MGGTPRGVPLTLDEGGDKEEEKDNYMPSREKGSICREALSWRRSSQTRPPGTERVSWHLAAESDQLPQLPMATRFTELELCSKVKWRRKSELSRN